MGKRGTDHTWRVIKYKGDMAIYARCKCGFEYNCGTREHLDDGTLGFSQVPTFFYRYCPNCGAKKKWRTEYIKKIGKYRWE